MLKAVVFDDEYIVLQGLRTMIDWQQYGIELAGTAGDGKSALDMFRELTPDIVMTDIRMPGMDGLQLVEAILQESPETLCIVFSGFNEFEYVRRAINLGVLDYLEKPITIAKIDEVLKKTIERIGEQQELTNLKSKWEASRNELLEKATLDLLLVGGEAEPKWRESFGLDAERVVGVTVFAFLELNQALRDQPSYRIVHVWNGLERLSVVFHFDLSPDIIAEQLNAQMKQMSCTAGSGRTYPSVSDAPKSYKEALRALRYGRFLEEKGWVRFEDAGQNDMFQGGSTEREEAVIFHMRKGDKDGLMKQLEAFRQWMEEEKLSPELAEQEILKLAFLSAGVAKESGIDLRQAGSISAVSHQELSAMHSRSEMFQWLSNQMMAALHLTTETRHGSKHSAVEKALRYMNEHYSRDLSLQEVAEQVSLNATYFSLLFKEEVGISYIKHLTKIRLEHAKALLSEGARVNEVSEKVGYHNYRHFTEMFKKIYGITPGQYRESMEQTQSREALPIKGRGVE